MRDVYDISETAFREFSNKNYIYCDVPVGSYCAVNMSFITDDVHPLVFCVFDISDTPESPTNSCNDLYEHDMQAYLKGVKSPIYGNDYEVWHIVPDYEVFPSISENTHFVVYGYIAERALGAGESISVDLSVVVDLTSARVATELAYSIYNSPCYRVVVVQSEDIYYDGVYDHTEHKDILTLDSERRLYGRYSRRAHVALSQLRNAEV